MKYTKERINQTDTYTFEAQPKEGILALTREWVKTTVPKINHNWFESRGKTAVCITNGGYFGSGPIGGMMADGGYYNNNNWSFDTAFITLIYENNTLILDEEWEYSKLIAKYPKAGWMRQVGDPLVKDGKRYKGDGNFDHTFSRHPRTMIGQKADGTIVMFVTDGRGGDDLGYTINELANIALDKGCVTAVNLDGGGSSTMAIEGDMVNTNENRPVYDAFLFYADSYNLEHVEVEPEEEPMFTGRIFPKYNFYWKEVQSEVPDSIFKWTEVIKYLKNIILLACMLQIYRVWYRRSISIDHWFRPQAYIQSLKDRGYPVAKNSDHEEGRAVDCNVPVSTANIKKWKDICYLFNVYPAIGRYNWGMHLGFNFERARNWDYR